MRSHCVWAAALLFAGAAEAQTRALVISSSGAGAHDLLTTLRETGIPADFRPGERGLPPPRETLKTWGVVVLPSDAGLPHPEVWKLVEYVRLGGGALLLSQGGWGEYAGTPLEDMAPTFFGYEHPTPHAVRISSVAVHPAVSPASWEARGPLRPSTETRPPDDPRFARPKTNELQRFHKPLLSREWTVLLRGDDPARTPLLVVGLFGAGRVAVASFSPQELTAGPDAGEACRRLLQWLAGTSARAAPHLPRVLAVGLPDGALVDGMGFSVRRDVPGSWTGFDAVACGGQLTAEMAGRVCRYLRRGGTVVLLEPGAFGGPLAELSSSAVRETAAPAATISWTRDGTRIESSGDHLLPPWVGRVNLVGEFTLNQAHASGTVQLRWGRAENTSLVIGDIGIHAFAVNGHPIAPGQDGVCSFAGLLRPGRNTLETWSWGDGIHPLPLPRLESGASGRLVLPNGWVTRQSFAAARWNPTSGETVWRWEDGRPALVRSTWGEGTLWWLTASVLGELVDPRAHQYGGGRPAKRSFFRETTINVPSLAVHYALYGDDEVASVEPDWSARRVRVWIPSGEGTVVWRLHDWQRCLLAQGGGDEESWVDLPERGDPLVYEATGYRDRFWIEAGVLSPAGNALLSWHERWLAPGPGANLEILLPTVAQRSKGPFVTFPRPEDLPSEWTERGVVEFPLFPPGAQIDVTVVCTSASGTTGTLTVVARLPLSGRTLPLLEQEVALRAGVPQAFEIATAFDGEFVPCRLEAELRSGGSALTRTTKLLYVVQPWRGLRSVLEVRNRGMQVMGSLYDQSDAEQFAVANLLADPPRGLYWGPYASTYPGQPWCNWHPHPYGLFPNGQYYRDWLRPQIRSMAAAYGAGTEYAVSASLVDGFNGVPDPEGCFFPQNLYAFLRWMDESGEPVTASTVGEVVDLVRWSLFDRWSYFIASELALRSHEIFKDHLTELSPWSDVTDQCDLPLLHQILHIPHLEALAPRWESVFSLSSTDAWNVQMGRGHHSPTYTQMLAKSLAPGLRLGHYHMEMFGGDGVELIGLTERMRRQNYDAFWMMAVDRDGTPRPLQDYFDGGGVSWLGGWRQWLRVCADGDRGGNVDTDHDWWALTHAYALMEAVGPEEPVGGCWLVASDRHAPDGYDPDFLAGDGAWLFSLLRDNGVSLPVGAALDYSADLTHVEGVVLVPPAWLGDRHIATLRGYLREGKGVALVQSLGKGRLAESPLDRDFGLRYLGPKNGPYQVLDRQLSEHDRGRRGEASSAYGAHGVEVLTELSLPTEGRGGDEERRVVIGTNRRGKGRTAFWADGVLKGPFAGGRAVDHALARVFARAVNWALGEPVTFAEGTCGYAFTAKGMTFVVVEELTGLGRVATVGLRTAGDGPHTCVDLNSNKRLGCRRTGKRLWIDVPLRPSGATLVVVSSS